MSDRTEDQIRRGLQLLADEVELPVQSRRPARHRRRAVVLAFAVVAVAALGVVLGTRGSSSTSSSSPAPRSRSPFMRDRFDYRSAPLTFLRDVRFGMAKELNASAQSDWMGGGGDLLICRCSSYNVPFVSDVSASSSTNAWIVGSDWRAPQGVAQWAAWHRDGVAWHWDGDQWRAVAVPGGRALSSVTTIADGEAWAVGSGVIAHWDGAQWHVTRVWHRYAPDFVSVSASAPDNAWAVGQRSARLVVLQWNGHAWNPVAVPWAERSGYVSKIITTGPTDVWVVTGNRIEHWDGQSWQRIPRPFGGHDPTFHFSASAADDAWAVGSYVLRHHFLPLAAHWNGHVWEIARSQRRGQDSAYTDVVAIGPDDAWAVAQRAWNGYYAGEKLARTTFLNYDSFGGYGGYGRTYFEHWDGYRWTVMPGVRPRYSGGATALAATSDGHAWAIGDCYADNMIAGWNGYVWRVKTHPPDQQWPPGTGKKRRRHSFPHCHVVWP
jgi:hypothetical protein